MDQVRGELALANAQELINVGIISQWELFFGELEGILEPGKIEDKASHLMCICCFS